VPPVVREAAPPPSPPPAAPRVVRVEAKDQDIRADWKAIIDPTPKQDAAAEAYKMAHHDWMKQYKAGAPPTPTGRYADPERDAEPAAAHDLVADADGQRSFGFRQGRVRSSSDLASFWTR